VLFWRMIYENWPPPPCLMARPIHSKGARKAAAPTAPAGAARPALSPRTAARMAHFVEAKAVVRIEVAVIPTTTPGCLASRSSPNSRAAARHLELRSRGSYIPNRASPLGKCIRSYQLPASLRAAGRAGLGRAGCRTESRRRACYCSGIYA
jgi:hypothetical protein